MEVYTIDAQGKKLGHIATEAASVLRGKNRPDFTPNKLPDVSVHIINASKVRLDKAELDKVYLRYSGYFDGQTSKTRKQLIAHQGYAPVYQAAIKGMLPDNRLRSTMIHRVKVTE